MRKKVLFLFFIHAHTFTPTQKTAKDVFEGMFPNTSMASQKNAKTCRKLSLDWSIRLPGCPLAQPIFVLLQRLTPQRKKKIQARKNCRTGFRACTFVRYDLSRIHQNACKSPVPHSKHVFATWWSTIFWCPRRNYTVLSSQPHIFETRVRRLVGRTSSCAYWKVALQQTSYDCARLESWICVEVAG